MRQKTTLREKYDVMLRLQHENDDFDPILRDLARAWGYASLNTVVFHLRRLHQAGLVKMKERGRVCKWRAVEHAK